MLNFTTRRTFLVPSFDLDRKEREKMDRFLALLERSGIEELFPKKEEWGTDKGGRPHYSFYDMMATILYGFSFGSETLRDLETSCRYDLRYFYLMQQERPSHVRFGNFINDFILPNRKEIFKRITKAIVEEIGVSLDDCFIDGSKFEADANKYKFVWKPTTYHKNLSDKIRKLLEEVGLSRAVPKNGIISSKLIAEKISEMSAIREMGEYYKKRYEQLCEYLIKSLEYEEKERICGPDRNSYYKTDHDATAMTLKADYYAGLGSSMHAAYNSQLLVSKGIIAAYYISSSRSDFPDFIPVLKAFYDKDRHVFCDLPAGGENDAARHSALPSNAFALCFGLCPDKETEDEIVSRIISAPAGRMAFFGTFAALCGLKRTGRDDLAMKLIKDDGRWLRMMREGAEVTFEAWGKDLKWNTSLFHLCYTYPVLFLCDWGMEKLFV